MRNLKTLVTGGLVVGVCLLATLPAMATTAEKAKATNPNADLLAQIKTLRQTDKGLADQLKTVNAKTQRKDDWAQKNYTALLAAKNDQISFEKDYTTALNARFTLEKDNIQLQIDRQAKNATNVTADLNNIITDLNAQIAARTQLVTDAQKVLTDLNTTSSPSTGGISADNSLEGIDAIDNTTAIN